MVQKQTVDQDRTRQALADAHYLPFPKGPLTQKKVQNTMKNTLQILETFRQT